uniref:Uncharacterized protein n=1 Tax=Oryza sativa subsp. japonica TaxID=39947 RepID=Q6H752_ORYSJ|nr:hypothetical protein [Oryza sativa Japonica Group]
MVAVAGGGQGDGLRTRWKTGNGGGSGGDEVEDMDSRRIYPSRSPASPTPSRWRSEGQAQRWRRSIQWGGAQHPEVNFNGELKDDDGCHDNDNDNRALRRFLRLLHPLSSPRSLKHAAAQAPSGGSDSLRWWGHHRRWSSVMGGG